MVPDEGAQSVPHKALTEKEVTALWGRDRVHLQTLANKHNDLVGFVGDNCK